MHHPSYHLKFDWSTSIVGIIQLQSRFSTYRIGILRGKIALCISTWDKTETFYHYPSNSLLSPVSPRTCTIVFTIQCSFKWRHKHKSTDFLCSSICCLSALQSLRVWIILLSFSSAVKLKAGLNIYFGNFISPLDKNWCLKF